MTILHAPITTGCVRWHPLHTTSPLKYMLAATLPTSPAIPVTDLPLHTVNDLSRIFRPNIPTDLAMSLSPFARSSAAHPTLSLRRSSSSAGRLEPSPVEEARYSSHSHPDLIEPDAKRRRDGYEDPNTGQ